MSVFGRLRFAAARNRAVRAMARTAAPRIVVFTMGKSGSTAIARAVEAHLGVRAFQVFRLEPGALAAATARFEARNPRGEGPTLHRHFPGALHLWEAEFLQDHRPTEAEPWIVCTTVREPVAQAVSAYFHGSEHAHRARSTDVDPSEVARAIVDQGWLRRSVRWFEREFIPALGIDAFATPFPHDRGWDVLTSRAARVLLLRQENLDAAPSALQALLGSDGVVPVEPHNVGSAKAYGSAYDAFLRRGRFEPDTLDWAYGSRYARHFYTEAELSSFRDRWGSKIDA